MIRDSIGISAAGEAVGVTGAVEALVRGADDRADGAHQPTDLFEDPLTLDGVGANDGPFALVEGSRLVDQLVRDGDLADIVQERAELDVAPGALIETDPVGDADRQLDDALAVDAGVGIVVADHVAEHVGGPAVGAAELDQGLEPRQALAGEDQQQERGGAPRAALPRDGRRSRRRRRVRPVRGGRRRG